MSKQNYEQEIAILRATLADTDRERENLRADLAKVERERDRLRKAAVDQNHQIEQTLGAALGYPRYCDDLETFPEATEADGVCVGDLVAETLAEEAADKITELRGKLTEAERQRDEWKQEFRDVVDAGIETLRRVQAERDRYRAALVEYATWANWCPCPTQSGPVDLCDWIGGGEGPDIAEGALMPATESEATDADE